MKVTVFFLILCLFGLNFESIDCIGEEALLQFLEEIRIRMCHPISKFGLPALDPFRIKNLEIKANNKYLIDFKGSVTDFRLTGLSDFIINGLKITTNPLRRSSVDVTLPLTAINSLYTAKGSLAYIVNLAGEGNAYASLDSFRLSVSWQLKASTNLGIKNLQIAITIGGIEIDLENLFEEQRLNVFFHDLVSELGLELLDDAWQAENKYIIPIIEKKVNAIIGKYTLADIIKIITGGGDGPIFGENDPPGDCKDDNKLIDNVDS